LVRIKRVENEADKMRFIKFPWQIYKGNKYWVPPLIFDVRNNLNTLKNPFYKHAEIELFLAEKDDGKLVGRIAAIKNDNHNKFHEDKAGFFGFFESVDDHDVSDLLLDTACEWCKNKGLDTVIGPVNPSTNDECALLVDGYDNVPVILSTYNPPYYRDMIESFGFEKGNDLYAYHLSATVINDEKVMAKLERMARLIKTKEKIVTRKINMKDLDNEVKRIEMIYNDAWEKNWGFVPLTTEEFEFFKGNLKALVDPDIVFFAEVDGDPAGFSLALPDYNQIFKKLNGRLFPFGVLKILTGKKKIDFMRVWSMGVRFKYQKRGVDSIFYLETIKEGNRKGYKGADISWVLEDNAPMRQTAEKLGANIYKTYRIYKKSLN
jgi:GNAT superfamily N-acetyltransferase